MDCRVKDAIIAHGVFMDKCQVEHAIIGVRQRIAAGCKITNAMVIGADYYESDEQRAELLAAGKVPIGIGADCIINNAIIDKNTRIGQKCIITNAAGIEEVSHPVPCAPCLALSSFFRQAAREQDGFYIRSGIVCVLRNGTISNGSII